MKKLFNIFKRGKKEISKWNELVYDKSLYKSNGIDDLYNRRIDGYIIKNILNLDEVDELISVFEKIDLEKAVQFNEREGYVIPRAYSQIQSNNEFDEKLFETYLNDASWFKGFLNSNLSFDIEDRIIKTISNLQGGIKVSVPVFKQESQAREFSFASFRFLKLGRGGMNIHCGSMFREIYPNFYKRLDMLINFDGQLSYFIMLQRPEKGGQLRLFDAEWSIYKKHYKDSGFVDNNGIIKSNFKTAIQDIDPKPGDLIVFVGGDIWHEVTNPESGKPRITIGGFLAYSNNHNEIYLWS
jgi:hapalindole-type alkaloid chlorinase